MKVLPLIVQTGIEPFGDSIDSPTPALVAYYNFCIVEAEEAGDGQA